VDEVVASLEKRFDVDPHRIFATGFSNGAGFTYLLWTERSSVFAAFAPVAGRLAASVRPSVKRPVFHVAGRIDGTVRFADQQDAIETAVRVNEATGTRTRSCGEGCTEYGAGGQTPVMVWIHEGGHTFPPGTSDRITSFFKAHAAPRGN
jgi:polyhydroxybutyrate depolymerase